MEADTPGRREEEIEMKEREESEGKEGYTSESRWFSQISPERTLTWKKGEKKYKYDFFNQFNPKKILNKTTKENIHFRAGVVKHFVSEMVFRGGERLSPDRHLLGKRHPFLKDIDFKQEGPLSSRFKFTYKGGLIGFFDPTVNDLSENGFTKVEGQAADDLTRDVIAYFGLKSIENPKSQIKSIMTDDKPKENITPPSRPPTPPKPSMLGTIWSSVKGAASYSAEWINQKSDENLDNTAIKSVRDTTTSFSEIHNQSTRNQLEFQKRLSDDQDTQLDNMNRQITQQSREIGDQKEEIKRLREQIKSTEEDNEELNQELEKKNNNLRLMETAFDNLKIERDRINNAAEKIVQDADSQINELNDKLNLTGSQILKRDEEIKMLKEKLEKNEKYVESYPQEVNKYNDTITELKNKLKEAETEKRKLEDSYKATKLELEEKNSSLDETSREIESLQSLLESEKGKVKGLEKSNKELESKNRGLVKDFGKLDDNYKATKVRLGAEELAKNTTILELRDLQSKNQKLLENKDLNDEIILELQQENEFIQKDLQDEKDSYKNLLQNRDNLEKRYRDLKKQYRDQQSQNSQFKSIQQEIDESSKEDIERLKRERDNLIEETQKLNRGLEAYKLGLDAEKKRYKLDIEKEQQKLKNSNERLQNIQRKLDSKEIDVQKFKRLFQQSENKYSIEKKSFDTTTQAQKDDISKLLEKNETQETRIQELEKIEQNYIERTKVKDAEVQEWIDKYKESKQQIDSLVSKISLQDVYLDQYKDIQKRHENTTREYNRTLNERNTYITDLSSNETKRHALEDELANLQKELDSQKVEMENLQKKMIDPQVLEETRNHVRELSVELKKTENALSEKEKEANYFREETENLRKYIRDQKEELETENYAQRKHYEAKIEKREKEFANQLKNYIKPGDQKAYVIHLDKLEAIEVRKYSDEEYEKVMKELRTIRDKYRRDAENPSRPSAKRRMDERFRKNVDYKIDAINHENEKAIETSQGKDIILEDKRGILGALYRLKRWTWETGVKYLGVIGSILSIIGTSFYLFCLATGRTLLQGAKDAAKLINAAGGGLPADIAYGLLEGAKLVIHYAKNTLVIATLVIISFVLLYRAFISPSQTEFLVSFLLIGGVIGIGYWYTSE